MAGTAAAAVSSAKADDKEKDASLGLGELVVDNGGARGVVRFAGSIVSKKSGKAKLWVGVEWLSSTRGKHKHAGEVDGKVYFDLKYAVHMPPGECTSASFVKPTSLKRGVSFCEALVEKYECAGETVQEVETTTDTGAKVETVGMIQVKEQQRIAKLVRVSLDGCAVSGAGNVGRLGDLHIAELNLGQNLIPDWTTICEIAAQLPKLTHLMLPGNVLKPLDPNPLAPFPPLMESAFLNLKQLVLSNTGTRLSHVARMEHRGFLPCLEELHLACNELRVLDPEEHHTDDDVKHEQGSYAYWTQQQMKETIKNRNPQFYVQGFRNLKVLDVGENKISSWSEIWRLARLPKLEVLYAHGNDFSTIEYEEGPEAIDGDAAVAEALKATDEAERAALEAKNKKEAENFANGTVVDPLKDVDQGFVGAFALPSGEVVPIKRNVSRPEPTDAPLRRRWHLRWS